MGGCGSECGEVGSKKEGEKPKRKMGGCGSECGEVGSKKEGEKPKRKMGVEKFKKNQ